MSSAVEREKKREINIYQPGNKQSLRLSELAHLEDLKSSDVQDPDERGPLALSAVQGSVDPVHQPAEQTLICGLRQSLHCKVSLNTHKNEQKHKNLCFYCTAFLK